jgi:hypothetical protein
MVEFIRHSTNLFPEKGKILRNFSKAHSRPKFKGTAGKKGKGSGERKFLPAVPSSRRSLSRTPMRERANSPLFQAKIIFRANIIGAPPIFIPDSSLAPTTSRIHQSEDVAKFL